MAGTTPGSDGDNPVQAVIRPVTRTAVGSQATGGRPAALIPERARRRGADGDGRDLIAPPCPAGMNTRWRRADRPRGFTRSGESVAGRTHRRACDARSWRAV